MTVNRRLLLARRPDGVPVDDDFAIDEDTVPDVAPGQLLVRNILVSLDPAMRGWLDDRPSYQPPVALGDPVRAATVGRVVASAHPDFAVGSWVSGLNAIADYSLVDGSAAFVRKLAPHRPLSHHLSVLGGPGLTAYFGLFEIGRPIAGETIVVSAAAGAVGSLVGQFARLAGCRTIGIAGGPEKCGRMLHRYGYDAAIDYRGKSQDELAAEIGRAAPGGVDMIFENVGGVLLDASLQHINRHARIALCGLVSDYNHMDDPHGARAIWQLIVKCATMQGFLLSGFLDRAGEAHRQIGQWLDDGLLHVDEHIEHGMENAVPAFRRLFDGTNRGKMILQLCDEEEMAR
ncbi:MAG: NADP-dependent oxidoreductase [Sphingopyxis macrogoltabida]|uniref:NADP-dependent oxidoreductase n=1 Tax=Sphingopyxis macrogoltabida TaxID=33050 RepID=A0A2W5L2U0_SPHMC|nr:MAG: NADP-dependent oxidoreductase [Sphingopyxis macrogoltabida]